MNHLKNDIEYVLLSAKPLVRVNPVQSFYPIASPSGVLQGVLCLMRESPTTVPFGPHEQEMIHSVKPLLEAILSQSALHKVPDFNGYPQWHCGQFLGDSIKMKAVYRAVEQVANTSVTVTIFGASGTGKELVARALHLGHHQRAERILIDVNCAAIPKELMESELFGHEKGAFSGATCMKKGKFELAHGGTLFLDEIGELPLDSQAKLLRVIQEKAIWRVGGQRPIPVDLRIVTATHRDLEKEVARGNFREDLFYRLSVFPIHLPALRERGSDILLLAHHFLKELAPEIPGFHPDVVRYFQVYSWPGNVRELRHCIERMVLCHQGAGPLTAETLFTHKKLSTAILPILPHNPQQTLDEAIRKTVCHALTKHNFNKSRTAKELGIFRDRLDRLMQKYSLSPP